MRQSFFLLRGATLSLARAWQALCVTLCLLLPGWVGAQANWIPDPSFISGYSPTEPTGIVVLPSGKLLISGSFAQYGVARLDSDGPLDVSFHRAEMQPYGWSTTVVVQPDGKLLIGGNLTHVDGVVRSGIARLNEDGTLDATFNPGAGANGEVLSIALQPDGKVLMGGQFTQVDGVVRNRIARLNVDGTLDATFNPGAGANGAVLGIALQPDGKVLMGGAFTQVDGIVRNHIARLDAAGALDAAFNPDASQGVWSVVLQPDGKVLMGGAFTQVGGVARNRIARLEANGAVDATFNPGMGANYALRGIALQPDHKILIGGDFTQVNGVVRNRIARLLPDGVLDASFDTGDGPDWIVNVVAVKPDGKVLIGGWFDTVGGVPRRRLAQLMAAPVAPAGGAHAIPTDAPWALGLLAVVLGGVGWRRLSRLATPSGR